MHYRDMGGAPPDTQTNISKVLKMTYDNFTAAALTTNVQARKALATVRYATVFTLAFVYYLTVFTYRYLDSRFDFKAQMAKWLTNLAPEADSGLGVLVVEVVGEVTAATQTAESLLTRAFMPVDYTEFSRESLMDLAISMGHSPRKNASRKTLIQLIESTPED